MASPLLALDLCGAFVFALSGALAAVRSRLDVFGVVVVGTVTAIGGGIIRDALLGATPPAALRQWPYLAVPLVASVLVFWWHPRLSRLWRPVLVLDAAGLGLFTVTGTKAALDHGLGPSGAVALGVLTGIGGGVLRDVLLREIPLVLHRGDVYALAAAAGALLIVVVDDAGVLSPVWQVAAAVLVFVVRVLAVRRKWSVPVPRLPGEKGADNGSD